MTAPNRKLRSLSGSLRGCPVCGGRPHARLLTKRRRSREERLWRREETP